VRKHWREQQREGNLCVEWKIGGLVDGGLMGKSREIGGSFEKIFGKLKCDGKKSGK
jgi:hypothetical protein